MLTASNVVVLLMRCRPLLRQQAIMEAVIAKLEEQGTDEEVIDSYKQQMTSTERLQLENVSRTVNKYEFVMLYNVASSSMTY